MAETNKDYIKIQWRDIPKELNGGYECTQCIAILDRQIVYSADKEMVERYPESKKFFEGRAEKALRTEIYHNMFPNLYEVYADLIDFANELHKYQLEHGIIPEIDNFPDPHRLLQMAGHMYIEGDGKGK